MGEWMEAYLESKDTEPNCTGGYKPSLRKCWGAADREGKCTNIFVSCVRVYCDECRAYFDSGEWWKK